MTRVGATGGICIEMFAVFAHEIFVRVGRQSSEEVVISPWPVLRGPCQLLCAMRRHRCEVPWVGYALA